MPRVQGYVSRQKVDYQHSLLSKRVKGIMAENNITQTALANYLDITPIAVHKQLKSGYVTLPLLIGLVNMVDADAGQLEELLKIKE